MQSSRASGFSLVGVLVVLAILGTLYVGVRGLNRLSADAEEDLAAAAEGSRKTVCQMNRQTISRELMTWSVIHPGQTATIKALRDSGVNIPTCPDGGVLKIQGEAILCSVHDKSNP